jgi:hypothetical protein
MGECVRAQAARIWGPSSVLTDSGARTCHSRAATCPLYSSVGPPHSCPMDDSIRSRYTPQRGATPPKAGEMRRLLLLTVTVLGCQHVAVGARPGGAPSTNPPEVTSRTLPEASPDIVERVQHERAARDEPTPFLTPLSRGPRLPDVGRPCRDSSECQGYCEVPPSGTLQSGFGLCSATSPPSCDGTKEVRGGRIQRISRCYD